MHPTFEITRVDGTFTKATASNWSELSIPDDAIKVEAADPKQFRKDIRSANVELAKLGREYLPASDLNIKLGVILARYGFEEITGDVTASAEMRCIPVGRGSYLTVTTYRMQSGRFEVVGYMS